MAEKIEKKQEEKSQAAAAPARPAEEKAPAAPKAGLFKSTPVLLGMVMILEAGILLAAFKMFGGGPKSAHGAELVEAKGGEGQSMGEKPSGKGGVKDRVEVPVLTFKAPNRMSGRTLIYEVQITVLTRPDAKESLEAAIKKREATIQDGIRTIVAQSDPEKLGGGTEPGLETFRRQVRYQLEEIVGEGMIEEVLIPRCTPLPW